MSWMINNNLSWYHKLCINILKAGPIPKHIAFIMDGNRRYAKKEHVETSEGHSRGFQKLGEALLWCRELGITEVTVYAFSIENFNRSKSEVDALLKLAMEKFEKLLEEIDKLKSYGVCVRVIGDLNLIPQNLRSKIAEAILLTKDNNNVFINIAFAYTSQNEITNSIQIINKGVHNGQITIDDINGYLMSKCMYSTQSSKLDILIRTSGEIRFSDFLLWQSWCSNIIFQKVLWPDFTIWHLMACIFFYQQHYNTQKIAEEKLNYHSEYNSTETVHDFLKSVQAEREKELIKYCDNK